jgi:hypothetical protein
MVRKRTKHIIHYALLNAFLLAGVWGCRKDVVNDFHPYPATLADLQPLLEQVPSPSVLTTFSLTGLSHDTMFLSTGGVRIFLTDIDQLLVDENGQTAAISTCQNPSMELLEVTKKSDLVAQGIPSVNADGGLLETAGAFRLRFFCGTTPLFLKAGRTLKIQVPESNRRDDLFVYHGVEQQSKLTSWANSGESVYLADWLAANGLELVLGYEIITNSVGWISNSRAVPGPFYSFCVHVPKGFSNLNTKVYMVYKNVKAVALLTSGADEQEFCSASTPSGYPVRLITVSQFGNQYWLGSKETETGANGSLDIVPQVVTEQQMLSVLKSF